MPVGKVNTKAGPTAVALSSQILQFGNVLMGAAAHRCLLYMLLHHAPDLMKAWGIVKLPWDIDLLRLFEWLLQLHFVSTVQCGRCGDPQLMHGHNRRLKASLCHKLHMPCCKHDKDHLLKHTMTLYASSSGNVPWLALETFQRRLVKRI